MNDNLIRLLRAWLTFYKDGSFKAKTIEDQKYNAGVVDGIKLTLKMFEEERMISSNDVSKIII